jgi:hypothetical protein
MEQDDWVENDEETQQSIIELQRKKRNKLTNLDIWVLRLKSCVTSQRLQLDHAGAFNNLLIAMNLSRAPSKLF